MASYENILYEKKRSGVLITLNRPHALNALNEKLWSELDAALAEAEQDHEIRAVVLTGAAAPFPPAQTSAAMSLKPPGPTAFPRERLWVTNITSYATRTAEAFWEASFTDGTMPSRSSVP